jgi:hypothetical protein
MNSRAKGRKNELKTKAWLEAFGWSVALCPMGNSYGASQDFFGCWDIIACSAQEGPYLRFIQVKSNQMPGPAERARLARFRDQSALGSLELWIWYDRVKEPRVLTYRKSTGTFEE